MWRGTILRKVESFNAMANIPRVYISGPITLGDRNTNFYQSMRAEVWLMENGFAPLNPIRSMLAPHAWSDRFSHGDWMRVDIPWVEVADAVLRLPGDSRGADMETAHAEKLGIPVFTTQVQLQDWKNNMETKTSLKPKTALPSNPTSQPGPPVLPSAEPQTPQVHPPAYTVARAEKAAAPALPSDILALHDEITRAARAIVEAKNQDYSGASGDPYANFRGATALGVDPIVGLLLRCQDKFQRIRAFAAKGQLAVKGEPVDDAITDVVNYMVLLAGLVREKREEK